MYVVVIFTSLRLQIFHLYFSMSIKTVHADPHSLHIYENLIANKKFSGTLYVYLCYVYLHHENDDHLSLNYLLLVLICRQKIYLYIKLKVLILLSRLTEK